jgi:hypothetical protein
MLSPERFRHASMSLMPASDISTICQNRRERNFDTALIKTLLSVPRGLFNFFHIQRVGIQTNANHLPWQLFIAASLDGSIKDQAAPIQRGLYRNPQEKREVSDKRRCGAFLFHL